MPKRVLVPNEGQVEVDAGLGPKLKVGGKETGKEQSDEHRPIRGHSKTRNIQRVRVTSREKLADLEALEEETVEKRKKRSPSEETFIIASHSNNRDVTPSTPDTTTTIYSELLFKGKPTPERSIQGDRSVSPYSDSELVGVDEKKQGLKSIYQSIQKSVLRSTSRLRKGRPCTLPGCIDTSNLSEISLLNSAAGSVQIHNQDNSPRGGSNGNWDRGREQTKNSANNNSNLKHNQQTTLPQGAVMKKG